MARRASIDLIPVELIHHICEGLSLTDVDAFEQACEHQLRDIVTNYFRRRALSPKENNLFELVRIGRFDYIRELASCNRLDVNISDRFGRTPLHIAAKHGAVEVVKALLEFPAIEKEVEDGQFQTALSTAIQSHNLPIVRLLLREGASPRHALRLAVKTGCLNLVRILLNFPHVNINETQEDNTTALFLAAKRGHTKIVTELLLQKTINPELRERQSFCTPFLIAASRGHAKVMMQLLRHVDVDLHACDRDERTALSLAAEQGHLDAVKLLLSEGNNPHRTDRHGRNCMHYAVKGKHVLVSSMLLLSGCDPQLPDNAGMTPLRLAVRVKSDQIVDRILDTATDVDYSDLLTTAAECSNTHAACRALEHVSPNIDHNGSTPILLSKRPTFIRFLLSINGIDPNRADVFGQTPLMYAVKKRWTSVVRTLLSKHRHIIDVDRVDNSGRTAMCYALELGLDFIVRILYNFS